MQHAVNLFFFGFSLLVLNDGLEGIQTFDL